MTTSSLLHRSVDREQNRRRTFSFPYRGGKSNLASTIVRLLPPHQVFVEAFGGSAAVLLNKPPSPVEVYNDVDGSLVNAFETIRNHPVLLLERCSTLLYSRQLHNQWRSHLSGFEDPDGARVELAARTLFLLSSGFSGDSAGGLAIDIRSKGGGSSRWARVLGRIFDLSERFRHVVIENHDFEECIWTWDTDRTLFFLDPPYFRSAKALPFDFTLEDHEKLASVLRDVRGRWIASYDDCPEVRSLYEGCSTVHVSTKLSSQKVGLGGSRRDLNQILIANFPIQEIGKKVGKNERNDSRSSRIIKEVEGNDRRESPG